MNIEHEKFKDRVYAIVRAIQPGTTRFYSEIAREAGKPNAARYVAYLMKKNFNPDIPCHRVILKSGKLGGYNRGGEVSKQKRLEDEGWHNHNRGILSDTISSL